MLALVLLFSNFIPLSWHSSTGEKQELSQRCALSLCIVHYLPKRSFEQRQLGRNWLRLNHSNAKPGVDCHNCLHRNLPPCSKHALRHTSNAFSQGYARTAGNIGFQIGSFSTFTLYQLQTKLSKIKLQRTILKDLIQAHSPLQLQLCRGKLVNCLAR